MPLKPPAKVLGIFTRQALELGDEYLQVALFPGRRCSGVGTGGVVQYK